MYKFKESVLYSLIPCDKYILFSNGTKIQFDFKIYELEY